MKLSLLRSRNGVFILAIVFMAIALFRSTYTQFSDVAAGQFPNPDSYYKLVLLEGYAQGEPINFNPRDNVPAGNWIHWSLPHSWTVWQLHKVFALFGMDTQSALIWAGASLTLFSMLLLTALVAGTILSIGTYKATLATALLMASNLPLAGYGQLQQITHHIFMLVPIAGAALCIIRSIQTPNVARDFFAGLLAGLALWISPETMPLVVIMVVLRMAIRLQFPGSGKLWPMAAGLVGLVLLAWLIDPPAPTFSAWSLDHISLAWLLFVGLTAFVMLVADYVATHEMILPKAFAWVAITGLVVGGVWLLLTPGATAGASGLLPDELKTVWWDQIQELKPASSPEKMIAWLATPIVAGLLALYWAWRKRLLWLGVLGMGTLLYALLGGLHVRMGAAGALVSALAFGLSISYLPVFANEEARHSFKAQMGGVLLVLLGPLQLFAVIGVVLLNNDSDILNANKDKKNDCSIQDIAPQLNALPASVVLTTSSGASELLYRTHHKVIAGNYHHNVGGLLDVHRTLLDTAPWDIAKEVIEKRNVGYILVCQSGNDAITDKPHSAVFYNWLAGSNDIAGISPITLSQESDGRWLLFKAIQQ
ncbi:hypothetical protein GCM10011450_19500 [Advenella faeciporci]|uniref:Uncharacterized protein n=1 Tax=Advenella faeciporci TaxID=797535 RepID=A0A918MYS3_9BURK|nr:hypothetical protein [Advenella faeciporci]GGW89321.1 hypothetical protein GCM10011450_19500 [Advenella faeciporci]